MSQLVEKLLDPNQQNGFHDLVQSSGQYAALCKEERAFRVLSCHLACIGENTLVRTGEERSGSHSLRY